MKERFGYLTCFPLYSSCNPRHLVTRSEKPGNCIIRAFRLDPAQPVYLLGWHPTQTEAVASVCRPHACLAQHDELCRLLFFKKLSAKSLPLIADFNHPGSETIGVDVPHLDFAFDVARGTQFAPQPKDPRNREIFGVLDQKASAAHVLNETRPRLLSEDQRSPEIDPDPWFRAQFRLLHFVDARDRQNWP